MSCALREMTAMPTTSAPSSFFLMMLVAAGALALAGACTETTSNVSSGANDASTGTPGETLDAGVPHVCEPQPVGAIPVTFHPAGSAHRGQCTIAEIDALVAACVDFWDDAKCTAAKSAASSCAACMLGTFDSVPATPFVLYPGVYLRNTGACIGLFTGETGPGSCALKTAAGYQCLATACPATACPRTTEAETEAAVACGDEAATSKAHCKALADAANSCARELPDETLPCFPVRGAPKGEIHRAYGELFCGSAADAGE